MAADESGGGSGDARLSVYAHCATVSCPAGLAAASLTASLAAASLAASLAAIPASLAASLAAASLAKGRTCFPVVCVPCTLCNGLLPCRAVIHSPSHKGAAAVRFLSAVFKFFCFLLAWLQTRTKIL